MDEKTRDLLVYGVFFEKDGKRIGPKDVFIMTDPTEQLRTLVEAREKATEGLWNVSGAIDGHDRPTRVIADYVTLARTDKHFGRTHHSAKDEDNAAFIALAGSTDLRSILSRMEKMEAALIEARKELWDDWHSGMSEEQFDNDPTIQQIDEALK